MRTCFFSIPEQSPHGQPYMLNFGLWNAWVTRHGIGRAIAQAVSRRFSTAAARIRAQFRSCGICDGQSGTGADFLRVLQFPFIILIPPTAPLSSPSVFQAGYNSSISDRRTKGTHFHSTLRNQKRNWQGPGQPRAWPPRAPAATCQSAGFWLLVVSDSQLSISGLRNGSLAPQRLSHMLLQIGHCVGCRHLDPPYWWLDARTSHELPNYCGMVRLRRLRHDLLFPASPLLPLLDWTCVESPLCHVVSRVRIVNDRSPPNSSLRKWACGLLLPW
jgi:hypothetical protein